jgi:hypothetical protein
VLLSVKPGGREPDIRLNVMGGCPPEVCNWYEYGCDADPDGSDGGEVKLSCGHGCKMVIVDVAGSGGKAEQVVSLEAVIMYCPGDE